MLASNIRPKLVRTFFWGGGGKKTVEQRFCENLKNPVFLLNFGLATLLVRVNLLVIIFGMKKLLKIKLWLKTGFEVGNHVFTVSGDLLPVVFRRK